MRVDDLAVAAAAEVLDKGLALRLRREAKQPTEALILVPRTGAIAGHVVDRNINEFALRLR